MSNHDVIETLARALDDALASSSRSITYSRVKNALEHALQALDRTEAANLAPLNEPLARLARFEADDTKHPTHALAVAARKNDLASFKHALAAHVARLDTEQKNYHNSIAFIDEAIGRLTRALTTLAAHRIDTRELRGLKQYFDVEAIKHWHDIEEGITTQNANKITRGLMSALSHYEANKETH